MGTKKYQGIFPALYACYDENGTVSPDRVKAFTQYLMDKGVQGLYVGGSSGECIYQSKEDRKKTLEAVMEVAKGKLVIIAHVACNNTEDSQELAAHAENLGVDAIASIPPIYFHLPDHAIAKYWNDISAAAPNTDFIIYNIPQLAGVSLSVNLLREMKKNPKVIGVKNSSMPVQDIQLFRDEGVIVFNGPDEQLISGLAMGASGGIGGTYGAMPELYLKIFDLVSGGEIEAAREIQNAACRIIYKMCSTHGNMYAAIKEIIRIQGGPDIGGVKAPLVDLTDEDKIICQEIADMIAEAIKKYC
ncbi:MAG: dihydrodipicolinate synthase family protein [Lachnospiraceae bacterium]|nr:dihydrodipicolinate synthase family protein [Lachnospiraceae bacterium]MDE6186467.1 dihydrodipicolinate synthase family protein [Lachnospiraceae bacterium]